MKKIELVWNIVHYFVYRADYKAHLLFNKINPLMLIHKLPFQKKIYEKRGINVMDDLNTAFKNPEYGISSMRAGGMMFILCALLAFSSFCLLVSLYKHYFSGVLIFILCIPFGFLNFYFLFYKDKYLAYFKVFEQKPALWRKRWKWISLGMILLILILLVGSVNLMTYRLHH